MPEPTQFLSGPRTWIPSVRVSELARRQWGVVTRDQLGEAGMSAGAVARAVRRRALLRLYPGVYAVGHDVIGIRGRVFAALMHAGEDAVLSHTTAGWWWEVIDSEPEVIHLSAPVARARTTGLHVHTPRVLSRTVHRRLPVTPIRRTLLDLASMVDFGTLRRAVAEADHRGLLDPRQAYSALGRGRSGSSALRQALELHLPELAAADSVLEERFLTLIQSRGLPIPEVQARIGPFRVDALWRSERVVVELDGHRSHARAARAEADRRRDLELRARGYVVLRYTWQQITHAPDAVIADLRRALSL